MTSNKTVAAMGILGALVAPLTLGCGSDGSALNTPPALTCGAGTVAVGGECVPVDGGTGGAAGSGGAAGQGGTAGAAGSSTGGEDAGADAMEAGGGGPGPDDDPCPAQPVELDCSDQCGGPTALCAGATCSLEPFSSVIIEDSSAYPYVFRTPSHPGVDPACEAACQEQTYFPQTIAPAKYGMIVTVNAPDDQSKVLKVKVGPPWWIEITAESVPYYCLDWSPVQDCQVDTQATGLTVMILTDDPNAPARNVVLDLVDKPGSCP